MTSLKLTIFGVCGLAVAGALLFGIRNMTSYVRTAGTEAREAVQDAIPSGFELKRAHDMLKNELEPEIRDMKHSVAELQVEVSKIEARLAERRSEVTAETQALASRHDQLVNDKDKTTFLVSLNGEQKSYSRDELEKDLARRLKVVKNLEATYDSEEQLLAARRKALDANMEKLEQRLTLQKNLELEIQKLEARLSAVEAVEAVSKEEARFDDSTARRLQELIDRVDSQVEVRERTHALDAEANSEVEIPVETESDSQGIVDEVSAFLGRDNVEAKVVDKAE